MLHRYEVGDPIKEWLPIDEEKFTLAGHYPGGCVQTLNDLRSGAEVQTHGWVYRDIPIYYCVNRPPGLFQQPNTTVLRQVWQPKQAVERLTEAGDGRTYHGYVGVIHALSFEEIWRWELRPANDVWRWLYWLWEQNDQEVPSFQVFLLIWWDAAVRGNNLPGDLALVQPALLSEDHPWVPGVWDAGRCHWLMQKLGA